MAVQAAEGADFTAAEIAAGAYFFGAALPGTSNNNHRKGLVKNVMLADGGVQNVGFTAVAGTAYRIDLNTAPTKTFTADASTNVVTFPSGYIPQDGDVITGLSNSGGALPGGLSNKPYVLRDCSGQTCKFADYNGATAVNITDAGTGTHTATIPLQIVFPAAAAGDTCEFELIRTNGGYASFYANGSSVQPSSIFEWNLVNAGDKIRLRFDGTLSKWCGFNPSKPTASLYIGSDPTAAANENKITIATVSTNNGLIVAGSGLMVKQSGWYQTSGLLSYAATADGQRFGAVITKNCGSAYSGAAAITYTPSHASAAGEVGCPVNPKSVYLASGDLIEMFTVNYSGGSRTVYGSTALCNLTVTKV